MSVAARPAKPITPFTVARRSWLTPSMLRVVFHAPQFTYGGHADSYVKLIFRDGAPVTDVAPERPTTRTYTVRAYDEAAQEVTLDFVIHGDVGLAGQWARHCAPGDKILARGPGGKWSPAVDADFHLFVGDESSLPAIESGLSRLADDARGLVVVEFAEHVRDIEAPTGVEVRRIVRGDEPYRAERLADEVAGLPWQELGEVSVFAHGERAAVKALRGVFNEAGVPRERLSLSGYWALGRIEDQFQAEKKLPIGQI